MRTHTHTHTHIANRGMQMGFPAQPLQMLEKFPGKQIFGLKLLTEKRDSIPDKHLFVTCVKLAYFKACMS